MSVTVVIPTTGNPLLFDAVGSVLDQTFEDLKLWVIIDGPQFEHAAHEVLYPFVDDRMTVMTLPENTGANGNYGHRVQAAVSHLINTDYLVYLDEDNWFDHDHIQSLRDVIDRKGLDWAHSLRKIVRKNGEMVCHDMCESLGRVTGFVDTNCYMVSREVAVKIGHAWNCGWGADRVFYSAASEIFPNFDCSGAYSVNYRLGGNPGSVNEAFFLNNNPKVTNGVRD